jgi:serine/threonine protein kinase
MNRDLKPENIFIKYDQNKKPRAYLADAGSARFFDILNENEKKKTKISISSKFDWMAPELLKKNLNQDSTVVLDMHKLDIFSIGLLALYCLDPQEFRNAKGLLNKDEKKLLNFLDNLKSKLSPPFFYMLRCMLSFSPLTRPSVDHLLPDFQYLLNINFESEVRKGYFFFLSFKSIVHLNFFLYYLKKLQNFSKTSNTFNVYNFLSN